MNLQELLSLAVERGVKFLLEGDTLSYRAPKDAMSPELREAVGAFKTELVEILRRSRVGSSVAPIPRSPVSELEPAVLSSGQERLWLIQRIVGDSPLYNVHIRLRSSKALDRAVLDRSVRALVARNAVLRTTFREFAGEPRAVVSAEGRLAISHCDLRDRIADVRAQAAERIAHAQRCQPFDLENGPLTRIALVTLAADDQILLVTQHHIITDAWSLGLLFAELSQHYRALLAGEPLVEPELLRYSDYAIWQSQRGQRESHKNALEWWKQRLAGLPRLELPYITAGLSTSTFSGDAYSFSIPPGLTSGLKQLAARQRCTLYVVLLSAWVVLLQRYSGQSDFVVGTVSSGRDRAELRNLLGFFVNTLALRVNLGGDSTVLAAIEHVRSTLDASLLHEIPFGDVVNVIGAQRGASLNPLIQASIVFENAPARVESPAEQTWQVSFEKLNAGVEGTAKFDLNLVLKEEGDAIVGCLEYATGLFEAATIERMISHLHAVLQGMVSRPAVRLSELTLLSDVERERLLLESSPAAAPADEACIHELFEAQVARTPLATAVVASGESCTFAELDVRANRLANYLRARGVGPDVRVGLCLAERSCSLAVGMLAVLKAGGAYVPLEPKLPAKRVHSLLLAADAKVLVTDLELETAFSSVPLQLVRLDVDHDRIQAESASAPSSGVKAGHLAYVIFTSGSTGRPKAVAVEHRQLANYVRAIWGRMNFAVGCEFAHVSTFAADLGHTVLFPPLCFGGCLHLLERALTVEPEGLGAYFDKHRIDCLKIVPSHLIALLSGAGAARVLPRQLLILGGEASSWDLIDRIRGLAPALRVMNHYGPTETTVGVLTFDVPFGRRPGTANVPLGRPLANTRVKIVDSALQPVPTGLRGELLVAGAQVARGYLGDGEASDPRFVSESWGKVGRGYRTGDFVRELDSGEIEFLGRIDHQLKVRGFRVELGEIEATLSQHPGVRACLVLPREDAAVGMRLVAYAVADDSTLSVEELLLYLKERLPDYMIPAWLILLESMPLGPNGKIDRAKLPSPPEKSELPEGRSPRTASEKLIARVWGEVLGIEALDIDQSFFALGGHSLLILKVHARLQQVKTDAPSIATLFAHPTIFALARWMDLGSAANAADSRNVNRIESTEQGDVRVAASGTEDGPALVELKRGDPARPPLFLIHQAGGVVNSYYLLAARLPAEQAVYAIRAGFAMDGNLERLAARYIEMARGRWKGGPYRLGGASFGGLVAYEMAQQLRHQHEAVGTLLMLDTEEPGQMSAAPQTNEEILQFLRHAAPELVDLLLSPGATAQNLLPDAGAFLNNFRECVALRCSYRPRPFAGDVVFFRASDRGASASPRPDQAWRPLVRGQLRVVEAPGNHMAMLQSPHVDEVAKHISSVLASDFSATL